MFTHLALALSIGLCFGMAISPQDFTQAWRRVGNAMPGLKASIQMILTDVKSWFAQNTTLPDLQVVAFTALTSTDQVIANAACKLYVIVMIKLTATATFTKGTDHATTCSTDGTQGFSVKLAAIGQSIIVWPHGEPMAAGFTMQGSTTGTGSTGSGANGASGFVILGNP